MEYIHYGHSKFDINQFKQIVNQIEFTKPSGGLWASRINSEYGWKDWCLSNEYSGSTLDKHFNFSLEKTAKILTISNCNQLEELPKNKDCKIVSNLWVCLDFEKLSEQYDAIEVLITEDNQLYYKLYGWDCDSILIMNPNIIITK